MNFNLKQLLSGDTVQLRYVKRYAIFNCLHPESVAEHSYYTSLYCMLVAMWVKETGQQIDLGKLLQRALLHDMEEARTGDILRMFKHRDKRTADAINAAASSEFKAIVETLFDVPEGPRSLERDCVETLVDEWTYSKDKTLEGRILAFADYLSVLSYLLQELQFANQSRVARTEDFVRYAEGFNDRKYDFIRPLVEQADAIVQELICCG